MFSRSWSNSSPNASSSRPLPRNRARALLPPAASPSVRAAVVVLARPRRPRCYLLRRTLRSRALRAFLFERLRPRARDPSTHGVRLSVSVTRSKFIDDAACAARGAPGPPRMLVHAAANRLPFTSSCLERSVVVTWLLGRRGHRCALVIESPLEVRPFQAHAWVDTADGPIGQGRGRRRKSRGGPCRSSLRHERDCGALPPRRRRSRRARDPVHRGLDG